MEGGHTAAASLAKKFDGAVDRPRDVERKSDTPVMGAVGAGRSGAGSDWGGLGQFSPRGGAPHKPEPGEAEAGAAPSDVSRSRATRGSAARGPSATQAAAAKTVPEDFTYTYLSPAQHSYDFAKDLPKQADESGSKLVEDIALRLAAAGAVGYLLLYSNLPYLIGLTRRKRRQ
jgi:hypothetical protein